MPRTPTRCPVTACVTGGAERARAKPIGAICARVHTPAATSIARGPAAVASSEPATGPHPPGGHRHAHDRDDPVADRAGGGPQVVVDRGEQLRPGAAGEGQDPVLITNGIHARSASTMAHQPRNPAAAHSRDSPSKVVFGSGSISSSGLAHAGRTRLPPQRACARTDRRRVPPQRPPAGASPSGLSGQQGSRTSPPASAATPATPAAPAAPAPQPRATTDRTSPDRAETPSPRARLTRARSWVGRCYGSCSGVLRPRRSGRMSWCSRARCRARSSGPGSVPRPSTSRRRTAE